jgi:GH24 family phage-related lysozyme (muramidase)
MKLNEASMRLILQFEVGGGEGYYNKKLKNPTWPGEASGVTIGVGYDLGFNTAEVIKANWQPHLGIPTTLRLAKCAGKTGTAARDLVTSVRDIVISWKAASTVYEGLTIPRFWKNTVKTFPGVEALHPNCQGALLSLVFNRGTAMDGDRRTEMRTIRDLVLNEDYERIADQIRSMKRLWVGTSIELGMSRRRDAEANLVLSALEA